MSREIVCPYCQQSFRLSEAHFLPHVCRVTRCPRCHYEVHASDVAAIEEHRRTTDARESAPLDAQLLPYETLASERRVSQLAVASLVLGICSVGLPIIAGVPGIICSAMAMWRTGERELAGRGMAIAGLVLSVATTLFAAAWVAWVFFVLRPAAC